MHALFQWLRSVGPPVLFRGGGGPCEAAWLWLRGFDAYLDNPFEVEAYGVEDC